MFKACTSERANPGASCEDTLGDLRLGGDEDRQSDGKSHAGLDVKPGAAPCRVENSFLIGAASPCPSRDQQLRESEHEYPVGRTDVMQEPDPWVLFVCAATNLVDIDAQAEKSFMPLVAEPRSTA